MKKQIEKIIREFINNNYQKYFATDAKELGNGWKVKTVYYDVDGYGFTDVLLTNPQLEPAIMCGTVRAECEITEVAQVCVDMMAVPVQ